MSTSVKLFDNKQQMIHIASEVVALLGISFYFSSKNATLQKHIEALSSHIEDQDSRIEVLEGKLKDNKGDKNIKQLASEFSSVFDQQQTNISNLYKKVANIEQVLQSVIEQNNNIRTKREKFKGKLHRQSNINSARKKIHQNHNVLEQSAKRLANKLNTVYEEPNDTIEIRQQTQRFPVDTSEFSNTGQHGTLVEELSENNLDKELENEFGDLTSDSDSDSD